MVDLEFVFIAFVLPKTDIGRKEDSLLRPTEFAPPQYAGPSRLINPALPPDVFPRYGAEISGIAQFGIHSKP